MTLQELCEYYEQNQDQQEEIHANSWEWWNMELDEMIDKLRE